MLFSIRQQPTDPDSEIGGKGEFSTIIRRHFSFLPRRPANCSRSLAQAFEPKNFTCESKGIPDHQLVYEPFFYLTQIAPAQQAHVDHGLLHDGADVKAVLLGYPWAGDLVITLRINN